MPTILVPFSGHNFTATYGETQFVGNLTPRIHSRLKDVKNCIFDGEMCGYDEELQVFGEWLLHCNAVLRSPGL